MTNSMIYNCKLLSTFEHFHRYILSTCNFNGFVFSATSEDDQTNGYADEPSTSRNIQSDSVTGNLQLHRMLYL